MSEDNHHGDTENTEKKVIDIRGELGFIRDMLDVVLKNEFECELIIDGEKSKFLIEVLTKYDELKARIAELETMLSTTKQELAFWKGYALHANNHMLELRNSSELDKKRREKR